MSNLRAVQPVLDAYHNAYRNPNLGRLRLGDPYALFPEGPHPSGVKLVGRWPDEWPNVDSPGVYLILSANLDILYVGKTSLRQTFGTRLSDWFRSETDTGKCRVIGTWSSSPTYVATIPVGAPFEAPSLEEYLIQELRPPDNLVGYRPEPLFTVGEIVSVEWPESRYGVAIVGTWDGRVIAEDGYHITVHFEYQGDEEGEDIVIDVGRGTDEKYGEKVIVKRPAEHRPSLL
jgi:hypothetical protein